MFYRTHVLVSPDPQAEESSPNRLTEKFEEAIAAKGLEKEVKVVATSSLGIHDRGNVVVIYPEGTLYCGVGVDDITEIVEEHIIKGKKVERLLLQEPISEDKVPYYKELDFFKKQKRLVLGNCGFINPEDINDYIRNDGYQAVAKVLKQMTPEEVIEEVKKSGLRGRGGAGFPTGLKWSFCAREKSDEKYLICNADEGDPGAFMDRSILEGDPHRLLEGMLIAAYAIGATEAYIYIRAEYPLAIKRLKKAIAEAEERGLLGDNILGSDFSLKLHIKEGAGAFVCGEETALMASIEGKRGMPNPRPPFPAQRGLWGKPSNINNVETLANVPYIILHGAEQFAAIGTEDSKGTKVFALTGRVKNTGLVEVPMGITLREVIYDIGGGILEDKKFKAVQIGGPSGGCLPESQLDLPIDYSSLNKAGAIMGSGGLVVMDETTCIVDVARFFLNFTCKESCGKCVPCREGTMRMLEILNRISEGRADMSDLDTLERLANVVKNTALCGLGQTAPNPVLSTLRYFRHEYEEHIFNHKCPAGVCTDLLQYKIIEERCIGCGACVKVCPVGAITGKRREPHQIDVSKCTKCGNCIEKCKFEAIVRV
ncbi:MAG: NADH-quinone oxidoreductase subunit NuoF [Dethiobacteria bacterium]|jgi:NADH-quinone oxidoreductase subunit F